MPEDRKADGILADLSSEGKYYHCTPGKTWNVQAAVSKRNGSTLINILVAQY